MSTLQARIEEAMRRNPLLSQAEIARACRVKPPSVTDWLNGNTKILRSGTAKFAAELFGCDQNWLALGIGVPNWTNDQHPSEGAKPRGKVAHVLSHPQEHSSQFINWGEILEKAVLPDRFVTAIPDDSMTPRLQAGQHIELATGGTPTAGSGVLVRDGKSRLYFRAYRPGTENNGSTD
jgi:hypothetical protein